MLVSPLTFYRGAALIMASDLSRTPRSGLTVQCCGDAHLSNFGLFASPERQLVFDVNDFDETLPGPWEWDVKRLATSILIAARGNGYSAKRQEQAVLDTVAEYRTAMRRFAAMGSLQVWYSHLDVDDTFSQLRSQLTPKAGTKHRADGRQGAHAQQHVGRLQTDARGRRGAAHPRRTTADRAARPAQPKARNAARCSTC